MSMTQQDLAEVDRTADYEARLARLWERNVGGPVGREDDYFQRGGDSLHGAQLLAWIQEGFGIELSLLDLFESRTIAAQTRLLLSRLDASEPAAGKPRTEFRYFGPPNARLFSALHCPASRARSGVVLCYPMGQEYMRIHRTYMELARSLASAGQYVLRFDYFGCGDSAGETAAGSLARWRGDVQEAICGLRRATGAQDVYVVGARIGANLVLELGAGADELAGIVLWEPIVNGAEYVAALRRAHRALLASNARMDGYEQHELKNCFTELVGFPISMDLHGELAAIDLLAAPKSKGMPDTLVLANSEKPALKAYAAAGGNGCARLDYLAVGESDGIWLKEDRQNKGLIPVRAVQAIVSWISRRAV